MVIDRDLRLKEIWYGDTSRELGLYGKKIRRSREVARGKEPRAGAVSQTDYSCRLLACQAYVLQAGMQLQDRHRPTKPLSVVDETAFKPTPVIVRCDVSVMIRSGPPSVPPKHQIRVSCIDHYDWKEQEPCDLLDEPVLGASKKWR